MKKYLKQKSNSYEHVTFGNNKFSLMVCFLSKKLSYRKSIRLTI